MATVEVDSLSNASRPVVEPGEAEAAGPGHDDAEAHGGPGEDARSNKSSELQEMVEEQEQTMKTMQSEIKHLTLKFGLIFIAPVKNQRANSLKTLKENRMTEISL